MIFSENSDMGSGFWLLGVFFNLFAWFWFLQSVLIRVFHELSVMRVNIGSGLALPPFLVVLIYCSLL